MPNPTIAAKREQLFAATSLETLVASLVILDGLADTDEHTRMVRAWTCDEIERRVPGLDEYMAASFDDANDGDPRTYTQRILDGLKAVTA